jgi:hypothetical protein
MDLPTSGERIVSQPELFGGRLLFTTIIRRVMAPAAMGVLAG